MKEKRRKSGDYSAAGCLNARTLEEALQLAEQYSGDLSAMSSVQVDDRPVGLEIYHITHDLVRFPDEEMKNVSLKDDGAYVCSRIAKELQLKEGDELTFSPYDSDISPRVCFTPSTVITISLKTTLDLYELNPIYPPAKSDIVPVMTSSPSR